MAGEPVNRQIANAGKDRIETFMKSMRAGPSGLDYKPSKITTASATHKGERRTMNEDSVLSRQFTVKVRGEDANRRPGGRGRDRRHF